MKLKLLRTKCDKYVLKTNIFIIVFFHFQAKLDSVVPVNQIKKYDLRLTYSYKSNRLLMPAEKKQQQKREKIL